jgi:tetratricopeptide (TPR) repeat protein
MTLGKGLALGGLALILIAVSIPIILHFLDVHAIESRYEELVNQGFMELDTNLDDAIRKGLEAKDIHPLGKEALLLLGRAYFLKESYTQAIEELDRILLESEEIDYFPETQYYLGEAYLNQYKDLRQRELWNKALSNFQEAARSSLHRSDAYFGMALLYFSSYLETPNPDIRDKIALNLKRCQELEAKMDGYVAGEPDALCPHCRRTYVKKSEDPLFQKLMDFVTKR